MPSARRGFEKPASAHLSPGNEARADPYELFAGQGNARGFYRDTREIQMRIEARRGKLWGTALANAVQMVMNELSPK
jgi:hypothetical protein